MGSKNFRPARLLAAAVGVVVALATGLGFAGVANAATTPDFGNIKKGTDGSITIHKHANPTGSDTQGDPDGSADASSSKISGVVFTVYKIKSGLDLTTNDGWTKLKALKAPESSTADLAKWAGDNGLELDGGTVLAATDANGVATFADAAYPSAYLVVETDSSSADPKVISKAQPFIVSVPFPDNQTGAASNSNGWLYDVNVYPKNTTGAITKTNDPAGTNLKAGDTTSWTISTDVPVLASGDNFKYYAIYDELESALSAGKFDSVKLTNADGDDVELTEGDDYTFANSAGQVVRVDFTAAGLAKLASAQGGKITAVLSATVTADLDHDLKNTAYLLTDVKHGDIPDNPENPDNPDYPDNPDNPNNPDNPGQPSNEVHKFYGKFGIEKVDAGDNKTGLKGATFDIYDSSDPYAATCNASKKGSTKLGTLTTDADGKATSGALFVSDDTNDPKSAAQRCYVLVETKAPAGYVLPENPNTAVAVKKSVYTGETLPVAHITNTKTDVPDLPLTGSAGIVALLVLGAALVGGAAVLTVIRKKQGNA